MNHSSVIWLENAIKIKDRISFDIQFLLIWKIVLFIFILLVGKHWSLSPSLVRKFFETVFELLGKSIDENCFQRIWGKLGKLGKLWKILQNFEKSREAWKIFGNFHKILKIYFRKFQEKFKKILEKFKYFAIFWKSREKIKRN